MLAHIHDLEADIAAPSERIARAIAPFGAAVGCCAPSRGWGRAAEVILAEVATT